MTTQNLWDAAKAVLRESLQQHNPTSRNKKNIEQTTLGYWKCKKNWKKNKKNQQKERNHKDQSRNNWKRNERNNSEDLLN